MRRLIILAEVALGLLFASCTKEEQRTLSVIPAPLKVELQQEIEKTPTERKILARIDYQEDKGMIYIKTKKPAEASEDSEGLIILKMKK